MPNETLIASAGAAAATDPSDRCNAPACMMGMIEAMMDSLLDRETEQGLSGAERRQLGAFRGLHDAALAVLTTHPHARTRPMFDKLRQRFRQAQRATRQGIPIAGLLRLPAPLPRERLGIDPPSLCWATVAHLREALEQIVAAHGNPARLAQLRVVAELENRLRHLIAALHRHDLTWDMAAGQVAELFAGAEEAIGDDLVRIFDEADALMPAEAARQ